MLPLPTTDEISHQLKRLKYWQSLGLNHIQALNAEAYFASLNGKRGVALSQEQKAQIAKEIAQQILNGKHAKKYREQEQRKMAKRLAGPDEPRSWQGQVKQAIHTLKQFIEG